MKDYRFFFVLINMNQFIEKKNGKYNQHKARFDYFLIEWLTISFYAVIIILFFLCINNFNPSPSSIDNRINENHQVFEEHYKSKI